jgi:anaerobic magnesium-protoporphyrin IX monomethyl ester cyclase
MASLLMLRTTEGMSRLFAGKKLRQRMPPFSPPLTLLSLSGVLEKEGHRVQALDLMFEKDPIKSLSRLLPSIDAIILSIFSEGQDSSQALVQFIKNQCPEVPIIIEGIYCSNNAEKALEIIPADVCILGEGEDIIGQIIKRIQEEDDLSTIPGVFYRENGKVTKGEPMKEIQDLNHLPLPARHLVENNEYGRFNGISLCRQKFTTIMTSRGCPHHCRFCSSRYLNGGYRKRSVENVLQEFQSLQGIYKSVMIEDDNFLADRNRAMKIMKGVIDADLDFELFITGARVDCLDRELCEVMKQAGVRFISFGIESGSQEILEYYQKGISLGQIRNAVRLARDAGMITWGNFIFGAPVETRQQMEETMKLSFLLPLDIAFFRTLSYQRGSLLWEEAVSAGIIDKSVTFCYADADQTGGLLKTEELERYCRWAFMRYYLRPQYILREFIKCASNRDFTLVKSLISAL